MGHLTDKKSPKQPPKPVEKALMNRMVLNYLIFEAYEATAFAFATQLGINLSDSKVIEHLDPSVILGLSSIKLRRKIKDKIFQGQIEDVIDILSLERPELLETNDYLYFKLLLLNLIEMIKQNTKENHSDLKHSEEEQDAFILKVIDFAKSKLLKKVAKNSQFMNQLELAMTLLLYCQNKESIPGKLNRLFRFKIKRDIFDLVNKTIIVTDSKKGESGSEEVDVSFLVEEEDFEEEQEENLDSGGLHAVREESSYKNGDDESLNDGGTTRAEDSTHLMTDSTLKKMLKLWIWIEKKIDDPAKNFKIPSDCGI